MDRLPGRDQIATDPGTPHTYTIGLDLVGRAAVIPVQVQAVFGIPR